jgi:hypothetical protein
VSKVVKNKNEKIIPIEGKLFIYIHKPSLKYAIFRPNWILKNAKYGMVEAWRSYAYRVPKEKFEKLLKPDPTLKNICKNIDVKNFILNFQHSLIDINKEKLSYLLQSVVDENKIVKIIPKDLDSFFKICFILDNLNKIPKNAKLWLIYLLSYINKNISLEDISKIVYCIDFLYSKIELKYNELIQLVSKSKELMETINTYYQKDGSYRSSVTISPLEETRYALFSINILEDLIQDMIFYYSENYPYILSEVKPIKKIYENIKNIEKIYEFIKRGCEL